MSGWNTDSGPSLHAESIGRKFVELGHDLKVFSFYDYAFHGTQITGKDEDYVTQCFTHFQYNPLKLNAAPFLTNDYELFIAEDVGMFPKDLLAKIFDSHIKKKAKTISIFHDNSLSEDPSYHQFEWDAIVCFDERYRDVLIKAYPKDMVHIIPYPCHPWNPGNKNKAREILNLPLDKKIIFTFGSNTNRVFNFIKELDSVCKDYPVIILALTKDRITIEAYKKLKEKMKCEIMIREETPSINRLYKYLYAVDLLLYYRKPVSNIVVASSILQCLGAGCPIIGNHSRYTEMFNNEIFEYKNSQELVSCIREVFEQRKQYKLVMENMKKYVIKNSSEKIAKKIIDLYKKI